MNPKRKHTLDILMIVAMFFSMSLHIFGIGTHKMIGLLTFILFIIHNISNRGWYKGLFKGNHTFTRMIHAITNFIVIIAMVGIMISGIILSKEIANGMRDIMTVGRLFHLVSNYVGCIGIAFHIGFHLKGQKRYDR